MKSRVHKTKEEKEAIRKAIKAQYDTVPRPILSDARRAVRKELGYNSRQLTKNVFEGWWKKKQRRQGLVERLSSWMVS